MPCTDCRDPDLKVCSKCGGKGRTKCPYCRGRWGRKCYRCKGAGTIRVERREGRFTRTVNEKCSSCRGTGWGWICSKCGRQPRSLRGTVVCRYCNGSGYQRCPRCGGKREVPCTHCGKAPPHSSGRRLSDDGAVDRPFEVQDKDSRKSPEERRGDKDSRREEMLRRLREARRRPAGTKG